MGAARRRKLAGTYPSLDGGPLVSTRITPSTMSDAELMELLPLIQLQMKRPGFMELIIALVPDDEAPGTPDEKALLMILLMLEKGLMGMAVRIPLRPDHRRTPDDDAEVGGRRLRDGPGFRRH